MMASGIRVGSIATTPTGRRVKVVKLTKGTGRLDFYERAICKYLDEDGKHAMVTLQPQLLRAERVSA